MTHQSLIYCRYNGEYRTEKSRGALEIYLPTADGYICHRLARTVYAERNADVWRLSVVTACDRDFGNHSPITCEGAEWEMALRIEGRPDFIGGFAHGDERDTDVTVCLDGGEVAVEALTAPTPCCEMTFKTTSVCYDPLDSKTEALLHEKTYTVTAGGIHLAQRMEWLGNYPLSSCYAAMMPPLKVYTDTYQTDLDPAPIPFDLRAKREQVDGAREARLWSEASGLSYTMAIEPYGLYPESGRFTLSDNGGAPYNKMYFSLCEGGEVKKGAVWHTVTRYCITKI